MNYDQTIQNAFFIEKVSRDQKKTSRPVLAITFDPRLPCIPQILKRHWRTMAKADPHSAEIFPLPPLTLSLKKYIQPMGPSGKNEKQAGAELCQAQILLC